MAEDVGCAEVILSYVEAALRRVAVPDDLRMRAKKLIEFWGDKQLSDIGVDTCEAYVEWRGKLPFARRELDEFRAAIARAHARKLCRDKPTVTIPQKGKSRRDYLTRDQAAALFWHLYKTRKVQHEHTTKRFPMRHIVPFVLAPLYTGTRSRRIWQASLVRQEGRPFLDPESGVFYCAFPGKDVSETKQAGSIRIPDRLRTNARRSAKTKTYVCEYRGKPSDPKKALAKAFDQVFGEGHPFVRHSLRHTRATWLLWAGEDVGDITAYLSMTREMLMKVYGHQHPDANKNVGKALSTGRAGRRRPSI
ncbi:hypothetical protein SAMN06297251_1015 [Fulvimarina manganoxydans]|uniref:Phage integrase family protein n=1 Tax=Fulvimarina manganoxydans TaxID=937218 RepID=A0A1W1Y7T5_9HYPH|nr:hypothetical protein [Fulvimarina manganoxydans]SMC32216.1 hypothetical protein SAMN06297251_1015 [Fulvimarina manganoxydans]